MGRIYRYEGRRPRDVTPIEWMLHRCEVDLVSDCWIWTGALTSVGYGEMQIDRELHLTHRLAYEHWVGPIPDGLHIDHRCRVTACFNPDHLEAVTCAENHDRGLSGTKRIICREGHLILGHNAYVTGKGRRVCRSCRNEAKRRSRTAMR